LPSCNRFSSDVKILKLFSVLQSSTVFAFAFAMLIKAKTFGRTRNAIAVVVLFRPFSALYAGRIVCWIMTVIVVAVYTVITAKDYLPPPPKKLNQWIQKRRVWKPVAQFDPLESGPDLEFSDTADGRSRRNGDTRNQNRIKQQVSYQVPSEG